MRLHIAHAELDVRATLQSRLFDISAVEIADGTYELSAEQYLKLCCDYNRDNATSDATDQMAVRDVYSTCRISDVHL